MVPSHTRCPNHGQLNECNNPSACTDTVCLALLGKEVPYALVFDVTLACAFQRDFKSPEVYRTMTYSVWATSAAQAKEKAEAMLPSGYEIDDSSSCWAIPNFEASWRQKAYRPEVKP